MVCYVPPRTPFTCLLDGLAVGTGNSQGRLDLRLADGKLVTQDVVVPVRGGSMTMGGPMSASDAASGMSHRHGMHHEMHHQGQ